MFYVYKSFLTNQIAFPFRVEKIQFSSHQYLLSANYVWQIVVP